MKKAFDGLFFGSFGASRAYLFAKVFLLLLALDTFMLMIGHAGRYGVAGFNVAHFAWLDALQPTPSASSYIAILILCGLLALVSFFCGLERRSTAVLFLLYTYSWSMSMLDSYQHHYFVSLILLCLVFFPDTPATALHPLPPSEPEEERQKRKHKRVLADAARGERNGWLYTLSVCVVALLYVTVDAGAHTWIAFFLFASAIALATWLYTPARAQPLQVAGFGFPLLGVTVAIVYGYTAIAKMDENWLAGHTILQISTVKREFAGLVALAAAFGIEEQRFWSLFATFVIPQELYVGAAYLLAVLQDRLPGSWPRLLCGLAFLLAVFLHVGAEAMGLEIGWFSYYMLWLGTCFLLPLSTVDRLSTVLTWPSRWLERHVRRWQADDSPAARLGIAAGSGGCLVMTGYLIDLPGAIAAAVIGAVVLLGLTLVLYRRSDLRLYAVASALAGAWMWIAIAVSPARWDFYRYLGGDLSRRGELSRALEVYERGERYAPPGESRRSKIRELKRRLAKD
jgi:hypothetical protein